MDLILRRIAKSEKSAHQLVQRGDSTLGEIWREEVSVVVSKITAPRRTGMKWRWFAKQVDGSATLGRGTRAAMLLGAGFKTSADALSALAHACDLTGG